MFNPQAHKERLTKKMVQHTQALQIAKVIPNQLLGSSSFTFDPTHPLLQNVLDEAAHSEQAVRRISPKYLVPDTNCFVDLLPSIQSLIATTQFIIAVPLVGECKVKGYSSLLMVLCLVKSHALSLLPPPPLPPSPPPPPHPSTE